VLFARLAFGIAVLIALEGMLITVLAAAVSWPCPLTVNVLTEDAEPYDPAVTAVSAIEIVLLSVLSTLFAVLYNLSVGFTGGVEYTFTDRG
jgi:hypothetical protein